MDTILLRENTLSFEEINLEKMFVELELTLTPKLQCRQIKTIIRRKIDTVIADKDLFKQLLINLMGNVIKAFPEGAQVILG